jgi:hypothetical protein
MIILPSGTVKLTLGPRLRGGMDAIINDVGDSAWMEEEERAIEGAERREGERRAKKRKSQSRALEGEKYGRQSLSVARGVARANPNSVEAAAASLKPAGPGGKGRKTGGWGEQGPANRWRKVAGMEEKWSSREEVKARVAKESEMKARRGREVRSKVGAVITEGVEVSERVLQTREVSQTEKVSPAGMRSPPVEVASQEEVQSPGEVTIWYGCALPPPPMPWTRPMGCVPPKPPSLWRLEGDPNWGAY